MHEALAKANFERDIAFLVPAFLNSRDWTLNEVAYPVLDVTFNSANPLRVRLHCDQWNELPPSVLILKADGTERGPELRGPTFHSDKHTVTGHTYICLIGTREYHTHNSHLTDPWVNYKAQDGMNLPGLLDRFNRAWRKEMQL